MEDVEVDIVMIGAGLHGLAFARFYLDTHPDIRLLILESGNSVGGVWSSERIFDEFWLQSPTHMDYFSDVPLELSKDVPVLWGTFPAKHISKYLDEYIDSHVYAGKSLRDRIWFDSHVSSLEKAGNKWIVQNEGGKARKVVGEKVVIATGLTSLPNFPDFVSRPDFHLPFLHHRDFGSKCKSIIEENSPYKSISVIGGGKSAVDMVLAAARAGKKVNWIIRTSGEGPGIFLLPQSPRYVNAAEVGMTRAGTKLNVSAWHAQTWQANMVHHCDATRHMLEQRFSQRDQLCKDFARYRDREGALPCFRDLEPDANGSFFWQNIAVGLIQQDDFWDVISQKVHVYRGEIADSTPKSLLLQDGREVETDILLCGTGWRSDYPFISPDLAYRLGLPHDTAMHEAEEAETWERLEEEASREILETYPILKNPPPETPANLKRKQRQQHRKQTPVRLYQSIASLSDPSILFLGRCRLFTSWIGSEAQAIWATAFWDGLVGIPPLEEARRKVAYMNVFSQRRYPSRGADGVNFQSDLIWYLDTLLTEVGLSSHRGRWWHDWEEPFTSADFGGCVDEYRELRRRRAEESAD